MKGSPLLPPGNHLLEVMGPSSHATDLPLAWENPAESR
jgi:hypothetical protein